MKNLLMVNNFNYYQNDCPTVLFMALGFNADDISGPWGIESFLQTQQSNVSAIVLLGSPFCLTVPKICNNDSSTFLLSKEECAFFENSFCRLTENKNT